MTTPHQHNTALEVLLARVEKAEGADRELDALLWCMEENVTFSHLVGHGETIIYFEPPRAGSRRCPGWPGYTASLDAALSLCERVLPGWIVASIGQQDDRSWWVELWKGALTSYSLVADSDSRIRFKTPALALIAALLKSLIAQGKADTTEPTGVVPGNNTQ